MIKKPISTKFLLIIIIFTITFIPSLLAALLYYVAEKSSLTKQSLFYERQLATDIQGNLESLEDRFNKIQYEITSQFVTMNLDDIDTTNLKDGQIDRIRSMENLLQSIRRTTPGINNIYIIDMENFQNLYSSTYTYNRTQLLEKSWLKDSYTSSKTWVLIPDHLPDYLISSENKIDQTCLSFITGLINMDNNSEFEYILQIDVNQDYIYSLIQSESSNGQSAVALCYKDQILNHLNCSEKEQRLLMQEISRAEHRTMDVFRRNDYIVSRLYFPDMNMGVYKLSHYLASVDLSRLTFQILLLILLSFFVSVIAATQIARLFILPFEKLISDTILSIENSSRLKMVTITKGSSYIYKIAEHFNHLILQTNYLLERSVQQEKEKRKLQIRMLQAQISPHFLYNTLNTIKWMALIENNRTIADLITALVDLLEYCSKDTKSLVPLKEEIAFLKDYVYIQKARNRENKIQVIYQLSDLLDFKVIKFSLQPAVENAFLHAFTPEIQNPTITLSGRCEPPFLILEISDNGIGFNVEMVNKNLTGIGIKNVDERIKLVFGKEYGQIIKSREGEGTTVILRLPMIQ